MGGKHYLPLTDEDRNEMLSVIGVKSADDLFNDIPEEVRLNRDLDLPPSFSEAEALKHLNELASQNKNYQGMPSFMGAGVYDHFIPSVIKHIIGRSEFYTSYTPYQPEISQGVLQAIFEYQTMICQLTGMDVSNASMYDGGTAVAEGAIMGCGATRRSKVLISSSVSPFYREVLKCYFNSRGLEMEEIPIIDGYTDLESLYAKLDNNVASVVLQQPNFFGLIEDLDGVSDRIHDNKSTLVISADPLSLPLLKAPVEYGADIVVGEGQGLGAPASFGGPLLGIMAAREKYVRQLPGRVAGETIDKDGNRGFVLTMQTREQHIRREKASSNICSNEALVALAAAVYLAALGPQGMRRVAELCLQKTSYARDKITKIKGFEPMFTGYHFKEFVLKVPGDPDDLNQHLLDKGILGGVNLSSLYPEFENTIMFAFTEKRTVEEIDQLVRELEGWR